jgi:glycosyltransferase involved in cell wall biosynthesis
MHVQRLLHSIAKQSYKNYEVIISDDSKSSAVKELVARFAEKFTIHYSQNIPSAGSPQNWNVSIGKARGNWIKLMHDDDWFATSDALEQFARAASTSSFNFLFSACNNIYTHTGKERQEHLIGRRKQILDESVMNLFYQNVIGHPSTTMYRKDDSILYDTRFKWVVDIDFYMKYMMKHKGYYYLPSVLVNIGTDNTQITNECDNNPYVELPEYLLLLSNFTQSILLMHPLMFQHLWHLVKKYRVQKKEDLIGFGYKNEIPPVVLSIIKFQRYIPRIILKQPPWSDKLRNVLYRRLIAENKQK